MDKLTKQFWKKEDEFVAKLNETLDDRMGQGVKEPLVLNAFVDGQMVGSYDLIAQFEVKEPCAEVLYRYVKPIERPGLKSAMHAAEKFLRSLNGKLPEQFIAYSPNLQKTYDYGEGGYSLEIKQTKGEE